MGATGVIALRELSSRNPVQLSDFHGAGDGPEALAQLRRILDSAPPTFEPLCEQHRSTRRALVVAGAAVAVGTAAVTITLLPGTSVAPQDAAASVLNGEAAVALHLAAVDLPPGDYMYTKSTGVELGTFGFGNPGRSQLPGAPRSGQAMTFSVLRSFTRQSWIAANGSGRLVERFGRSKFLTTADRAAWIADGSPSLPPYSGKISRTEGPGGLTVADLAALPTNPTALAREIEERRVIDGPPGNAETFKIIGELLGETDASPELRSALYKVVAGMPGVSLVGAATDPAGRRGVAVSLSARGETHELIFDPKTSTLLATKDLVANPDEAGVSLPAGTVIGSTTYLLSTPVSSPTATAGSSRLRGHVR